MMLVEGRIEEELTVLISILDLQLELRLHVNHRVEVDYVLEAVGLVDRPADII